MDPQLHEKLKKLNEAKEAFAKALPSKLDEIELQLVELANTLKQEKLIALYNTVHTLFSDASTNDHLEITKALRHLEIYVKQLMGVETVNKNHCDEMRDLFFDVKNSVTVDDHVSQENTEKFNVNLHKEIICFDCDEMLIQQLAHKLNTEGYVFSSNKLSESFSSAAALLINTEQLTQDHLDQLIAHQKETHTPTICIGNGINLSTRLKAVRLNCDFFIDQSNATAQVVKCLMRLYDPTPITKSRVLILYSNPLLATYHQFILQEANIDAKSFTNPLELLNQLRDFDPDLLLIDLKLRDCSGLELATALRQIDHYITLPIIFISDETSKSEQINTVKAAYADDFLTNPILPNHLISVVKSRIKRNMLFKSFIARDTLTGLMNYDYLIKNLEIEMRKSQRNHLSLIFGRLNIDHFKKINEEHGRSVGDLVINRIADLLLTRLRKSDLIGRYVNEEFAIIFTETTLKDAIELSEKIRQSIAEMTFEVKHTAFHVTVSIGLVEYNGTDTLTDFAEKANATLVKAKNNGRNQVCF